MEAKVGEKFHHFYGPGEPEFVLMEKDLKGDGKRSVEWDLNDWKWDGDLFIASPLRPVPATDCRSRQLFPVREEEVPLAGDSSNSLSSSSDEMNVGSEKGRRELEKRRRVFVVEESGLNDDGGNLSLKLGGDEYPIAESEFGNNWDGKNGKKSKVASGSVSNRSVCQVENCGADLTNAKDYHRRHKVCEMHSKASKALVANVMQRFCQQCSRFHVLQEFDEGKRSCRRRLAGHNRRRRKTHPETVVNGNSVNDDRSSSYLLITLLKILSNMQSNNSDQTKDQDLLSHLLRNLASFGNATNGSQDLHNNGATDGLSPEIVPRLLSNGAGPSSHLPSTSKANGNIDADCTGRRIIDQNVRPVASEMPQNVFSKDSSLSRTVQTMLHSETSTLSQLKGSSPSKTVSPGSDIGRARLSNIDLNNVYDSSQDNLEVFEGRNPPTNYGSGSPDFPSWLRKDSHLSSPPQTSGNSDSASGHSPSSSSGDAQSRTDRIVFKLFGKDPSDFPLALQGQILDWLSHSPTDIESYIRPGCIVLTIYLRLPESTWQELCSNLSSCLSRLLDGSNDSFWRTGWVYARVQHHIVFICSGQVVLETPIPLKRDNHCKISSVTPIAVSIRGGSVQFVVRGFHLFRPSAKLLCAAGGKYLVQETTNDLVDADSLKEHNELQCLSFPCSVPDIVDRGFIEVEEHGLSSGFFPFIVAEHDVCSEIRMLENAIEMTESLDNNDGSTEIMNTKTRALNFIHELGWLLHRVRLRGRLSDLNSNLNAFEFSRFKWLMDFSMDRDWCAVVKKLLDIVFDGTVSADKHPSVELALLEMGLLHRAVRRSCRPMVELLLGYIPNKALATEETKLKQQVKGESAVFFFKPDAVGPAGLTPLHLAASRDGSKSILDALTNDPGLVGVQAWKNARDSTGFTPEDYARFRGHYSYIHLVHSKINKISGMVHIVDIPAGIFTDQKLSSSLSNAKAASLEIDKSEPKAVRTQQNCKLCERSRTLGNSRSYLAYRPVLLSMVAIATVCVCVALLFKSSPEVLFVYPFRWELVDYGFI
ncbi:hypothetical protein Sjap_007029 [Stephania japonica]|uniref:SBP-type domain-containing protein n=1 Tax=Stephania japonica TaxID=461633 RepID=A0AAP0K717_9MAGN